MSFYGKSFIYNGVPSDTYGLFINSIDAQAVNKTMGSNALEIMEQKIYRRATPFFFGSTPSQKLSFPFSAFSDRELMADEFQAVQKWLFSSRTYKRLQVVQDDMQEVYFNCFMNNPEIVRVGNLIQGFGCTVECDSPFAYRFPKTVTYTYTQPTVSSTKIFYNYSDDGGDYLYPTLSITVNSFGGTVTIRNVNESLRETQFTSLSPNEVLTVNCGLQTISSSTGLRRLGNFNKKFLRLLPGKNELRISGSVASLSITTQFVAKKIGG